MIRIGTATLVKKNFTFNFALIVKVRPQLIKNTTYNVEAINSTNLRCTLVVVAKHTILSSRGKINSHVMAVDQRTYRLLVRSANLKCFSQRRTVKHEYDFRLEVTNLVLYM